MLRRTKDDKDSTGFFLVEITIFIQIFYIFRAKYHSASEEDLPNNTRGHVVSGTRILRRLAA
jgi:hypothetical protein